MKRIILALLLLVGMLAGCSRSAPPPPAGPSFEYTGEQLNQWYTELNKVVGSVKGLSSTYVDNKANQIVVSVTTVEARERLVAALEQAGIPLDAVRIDLPEGALSEADPLKGCLIEELPQLPEEKPSKFSLQVGGTPLRPGQEFTLQVVGEGADDLIRGIDSYLECWDGSWWSPRYALYSDRGGDGPLSAIYSPNQGVIDIGFYAAQPGRFVLPQDLPPGWYRIRMSVVSQDVSTLVEVQP